MAKYWDCKVSSYSAYFEGAFHGGLWEQYKGVIVNARNDKGYGHFAIRKPHTFWFKLPKFIKNLFPYKWVMVKNDREKMHQLYFNDSDRSINIVAEMLNLSYRKLTFDKKTYEDLKENVPTFLREVGYNYLSKQDGDILTLDFDPIIDESVGQ